MGRGAINPSIRLCSTFLGKVACPRDANDSGRKEGLGAKGKSCKIEEQGEGGGKVAGTEERKVKGERKGLPWERHGGLGIHSH